MLNILLQIRGTKRQWIKTNYYNSASSSNKKAITIFLIIHRFKVFNIILKWYMESLNTNIETEIVLQFRGIKKQTDHPQ